MTARTTRSADRTPSDRRGAMKLILALVVVVAIGGVIGTLWYRNATAGPTIPQDALFEEIVEAPFVHSVLADGTTESSSNVEIECHVEARGSTGTMILWVIDDASMVKEGDVVCRLDASQLETERDTQRIACNTSHALKEQAKNTFEAAQEAKREYLEGTYEQERKLILNELFLAEEKLRRAKLSYDSGVDLVAKSLVTELQLEGDLVSLEKAQNEVDLAKLKLQVLDDLTRKKQQITLDSDIATAKAQWEAEEESYALELKKLNELEEQIRNCEIVAPADGQIVYANDYDHRGNADFVVAPGSTVREGQTIMRIPDPNQMQVRALVNESQIGLVDVGLPVKVRLRTVGNLVIDGEVSHVNLYNEPLGWSRTTKEYATIVKLKNPSIPIRAGSSASTEIVVQRLPRALQIPVQAVAEHGGKRYCLVKQGEVMETREIEVGANNDVKMIVTSGNLKPGDEVVLNPRRYGDFLTLPKLEHDEPETDADPADESGSESGSESDTESEAAPKLAGGDAAGAGSREPGGSGSGGPGAGGPGAGGPGAGGPGGGPGGGARDPAAMIKRLDTNGDGKLASDEISAVPEQFKARLTSLDKNGDGDIDAEELRALAAAGGPGAGGPGGGGPPRGTAGAQ